MATVISILHPDPQPQRGESGLVLSLSFRPPSAESDEQGYRMVARVEETGRVIGRWVSDCALTITETALLWCSKTLDGQGEPMWSFAIAEDSLDWQRVLDTVQEYAPGEQPGLPPRRAVLVLAGNFPERVAQPQARRALPGPAQIRRPGQPAPQPAAQPAPAQRMLAAPPPAAAPPAGQPNRQQRRQAPPPEPVQLGEEEQELTEVVRELYRALKSGSSAEEVRAAMLQIAGVEEDEEDEDDLTTWDDEEDDVEDEDEDEDEDDVEDDDEDDDDEDQDADVEGEEVAAASEDASGEDASDADRLEWEKGMRLYGADARAYEKLQRTRQRQNELLSRVYASLTPEQIEEGRRAAQEAARPSVQAEPMVEPVAEVTPEPAPQPKPRRNLRQLADTLAAPEPTPEPEPKVEEKVEVKTPRRRKASA